MNKDNKKDLHKDIPLNQVPDTISKITKQQLLLLLCMLAAVFVAYLPALHKEFINLDDNNYITQNPFIANFSFSKIPSTFSCFYRGQYSPVPSVVYGFINMLVGFKPFLYNLVAILLHLFTVLLVFMLIGKLCNNFRIAIITSALFGIATMQVESVAWLSAVYKTCLYSIFFLISLILYIKYIKTNKNRHLIFSLFLFVIACVCKEQAVSLSLVVIAIDLFFGRKLLSKKVIIEKIPFILISVIFGLITIAATKTYEGATTITSFSLTDRIIYASYALCTYIYKLFVPVRLALNYPYFSVENSRFLYMIFPLILLALACLFIWAIKRKNKYIIFGGLFFLLNILFSLLLQIVAVRSWVMADRYVYLASIGVFFIFAKGTDILIDKKLVKLPVIATILVVFFLGTSYLTYSQTKVWKNSMTLWNDVISKYQTIAYAYYLRGNVEGDKKDYKAALDDFSKAIAIRPKYAEAYYNRGVQKMNLKDRQGALEDFTQAIEIRSTYSEAYINRGSIKASMGDRTGAIDDFTKAIEIVPSGEAYCNRGNMKLKMGNKAGALEDFNKSIDINPNYYLVYYNRGNLRVSMGDKPGAIADFEKAISINPNNAEAYNNKGSVMVSMGNSKDAISSFDKAIEINTNYLNAYVNRAIAKYNIKDLNGAMDDCQRALSINPNDEKAQGLKSMVQQELQSNNH